jgi:hypothetical protein
MQVQTKVIKSEKTYKSPYDAISKIIKKEGISGLYVGLVSGLAGNVVAAFSYYYIYSTVRNNYHKSIGFKQISTAMELTLGATAGALCQFIVLPIGIVTTRQQTNSEKLSIIDTIKTIIQDDGIQDLWKGLRASLVLCVNPAITFGMFERIKGIILSKALDPKAPLNAKQAFIIGAMAKALATIVTCIKSLIRSVHYGQSANAMESL